MGISVSESQALRVIELNHEHKQTNLDLKLSRTNNNVLSPRNNLQSKQNYQIQRVTGPFSDSRRPYQNIEFQPENSSKRGQENRPNQISKKQLSHTDRSRLTFEELVVRPNEQEKPVNSSSSALRARKVHINKKK